MRSYNRTSGHQNFKRSENEKQNGTMEHNHTHTHTPIVKNRKARMRAKKRKTNESGRTREKETKCENQKWTVILPRKSSERVGQRPLSGRYQRCSAPVERNREMPMSKNVATE